MSLRIFSTACLCLLSACGGPPDGVAPGNGASEIGSGTPVEAPAEHVACAIGDADFADVCTIERASAADGQLLTIRHPDGGFRRLRISADGASVAAADGALPAEVLSRSASAVEVAIGDVRYRLPLTR